MKEMEIMKKIWLLLLLLLALIFLCVWCHTNEIYQKHLKTTAVPLNSILPSQNKQETDALKQAVKKPIAFAIEHDSNGTSLNGTFGHYKQETSLSDTFLNKKSIDSKVDLKYQDDMSIVKKIKTILPHFLDTFEKGSLVYQNELLTIKGETTSQDAKKKLDDSLATLGLDFVNHTTVVELMPRAEKNQTEENQTLTQNEKDAIEEIQEVLEVENIEFKSASSQLSTKGKEVVKKLQAILVKYNDVNIMLAGHTDSNGDNEVNLLVSEKRVQKVREMLIALGIDESRMETKGFGETKPLVPNTSAENKQKNRRVEITIIKGE
jgi:outer membrane protein OmpA-like peptidoglycan-associated protein